MNDKLGDDSLAFFDTFGSNIERNCYLIFNRELAIWLCTSDTNASFKLFCA